MGIILQDIFAPTAAALVVAAQPAAAPAPPDLTSVRGVLAAVESSDLSITSLQADVYFVKEFTLTGDPQTRWGKIAFEQLPADAAKPDASRRGRFAVRFDKLQLGDRLEEVEQTFIFDGRWLHEKDGQLKQYISREIVSQADFEASAYNPLRLGEGPLPIPLGQKTADIEARYDVSLPPLAEGLADAEVTTKAELEKFVEGCVQLRLVPREGFADDEFTEVRLWYKPLDARLLPRMVRAQTREGFSIVQLRNLRANTPIPGGMLDVQPPSEAGWIVKAETLPPAAPVVQQPEQIEAQQPDSR
jgi:hypothetical protein